jgi:DNA-binding transcriptional LysR family regulator
VHNVPLADDWGTLCLGTRARPQNLAFAGQGRRRHQRWSAVRLNRKTGLGLCYVPEPYVRNELQAGQLVSVLDAFGPKVPGYFLYYPSRAQRSEPPRLFIETAKELLPSSNE